MTDRLRAISLWQPWASLWIAQPDAKVHETRSWPTRHRGPLAVHASKKIVPPNTLDPSVFAAMAISLGWCKAGEPPDMAHVLRSYLELPRGGVIGTVEIVGCVRTEMEVLCASPADLMFGNWLPGRYAWRRADVPVGLVEPVQCRGFQGIWTLDRSLLAAIERRLMVTS